MGGMFKIADERFPTAPFITTLPVKSFDVKEYA